MNIFTDAMTGENCVISVPNTTKKRDIPRHLRCMAVQTAVDVSIKQTVCIDMMKNVTGIRTRS